MVRQLAARVALGVLTASAVVAVLSLSGGVFAQTQSSLGITGLLGAMGTPGVAGTLPLSGPVTTTLQPGGSVIEHSLDVNVVFVGLEPGTGIRHVDVDRFLSGLHRESRPRVGIPFFYGIGRDLGLQFTYNYQVTFAPMAVSWRKHIGNFDSALR